MRRPLLILLLFWLPLQFAWGAAASFCQHEEGQGINHFGHHTHKHQGKVMPASGEPTPDKKGSLAGEDFDCRYCHISCAQPLASEMSSRLDIEASQHLAGTYTAGHSPHVPDLIERPKWTLAA